MTWVERGGVHIKTESLGICVVQSASIHCSMSFQLDTQPSVADKAFSSEANLAKISGVL